jgi:hypothetical protein
MNKRKCRGFNFNNDSGHGLTGKESQMTRLEDLQPTKRKHSNPQTRALILKASHLTYKWNHKPVEILGRKCIRGATVNPQTEKGKHEVCYFELSTIYICIKQRIHHEILLTEIIKNEIVYSPWCIENPGYVLPLSIAHQSRTSPNAPVVLQHRDKTCVTGPKGERTMNECYLEVLTRGVKVGWYAPLPLPCEVEEMASLHWACSPKCHLEGTRQAHH